MTSSSSVPVPSLDERLLPDAFWAAFRTALEGVSEERSSPPADAKIGAVLVLLEDTADGPVLILTRRRRDLRSHPGQVSFPGGRVDPGEGFEEAALREAQEEIGLDADSVEVIGIGPTFYIPPSRFWVVPIAARWVAPHDLEPNPWEVDEILRVPLSWLLDRDHWRHVPLSLRGSSWAWQLEEDLLWGATAIVCALLLEVVVPDWHGGIKPDDLPDELSARPWEDIPAVLRSSRIDATLPEVPQADVPHVTVAQMRAVDDALGAAGLGLSSLLEQAAHGLVRATRLFLAVPLDQTNITVAIGSGGNGAGGWAAVRLFVSAGATVQVLQVGDPHFAWQRDLVSSTVTIVDVRNAADLGTVAAGDVVIDAMLGLGADPPLRDRPAVVGTWLRDLSVPVIALDLPSGLSGDIGLRGKCVTADLTVTLGLPKVGILDPITHPYIGDLYVADLGVPPHIWADAGVESPGGLFAGGPLVRLTDATRSDAGTPDQGEVPATAPEPPDSV